MDITTLTLFVACLLFAGFNALLNAHIVNKEGIIWKLISFILVWIGLLGAGYLLIVSFINFVK